MSIVYVPERYISALNQAEENAVTDYKRKLEVQIRERIRCTGFYESLPIFSNYHESRSRSKEQATLEWLLRDVLNVSVI